MVIKYAFFFTRIHFPRFSLTNYEKEIEKNILQKFRISSKSDTYKHQLELKKHASIMASSLHQLREVSDSINIDLLEQEIHKAVLFCLNDNYNASTQAVWNLKSLQNTLSLVEREVKESKWDKTISTLCIITNSILFSVGAAGVFLFGAAMVTGSIGIAFFGLGMAILSATVLAITAYNIYVDGKSLFNKQLNDIDKGIEFLINYPSLTNTHEHEPNTNSI